MGFLRKKYVRIVLVGLLVCGSGLTAALLWPRKPPQILPSSLERQTTGYPYTVVIYSDTHASTYSFYKKLLSRDVTALIQKKMIELGPAVVINTGDLVQRGTDKGDWADFDKTNEVFRALHVPYYPVLGNHDVVFEQVAPSLENYFARFPQLNRQRWYSFTRGNACFIVLDSNFSRLSADETAQEQKWLAEALATAEADPAVSFTLVFHHEPAYSNAISYLPNERVQSQWVPLFNKASKLKFVFSGHVHYYERFKIGTINYVVNGTAGMPFLRQYGRPPEGWRYHDEYAPDKPHGQNFTSLTFYTDKIVFKTYHLDPETYAWQEGDALEVTR